MAILLLVLSLQWFTSGPSTPGQEEIEQSRNGHFRRSEGLTSEPSTPRRSEEYTAAVLSQLAMPSQQAGGVPRAAAILFINMDRRLDRRKRVEQELSDLFATRPSRFAGWSWQRMPGVVPSPTLRQEYTPFVVGTMGCTMSHIAALSLESPAEQVLVVMEGKSTHFTSNAEQ